ncbi:hypothetical protein G5I_13787 [Acromyrmex echinatior]|uniref:Uncharacterized protein n=1 Tax=Acromyrmex echinatior TaxID=103372 RepID=F4X5Z3_ACREC|nr:hypothetical protein G5I_13787 [Acromyrmex echinatior]
MASIISCMWNISKKPEQDIPSESVPETQETPEAESSEIRSTATQSSATVENMPRQSSDDEDIPVSADETQSPLTVEPLSKQIRLNPGAFITSVRAKNCSCMKWTARRSTTAPSDCRVRTTGGLEFDNYKIENEYRSSSTPIWNASYPRRNPTKKMHRRTRINSMTRLV